MSQQSMKDLLCRLESKDCKPENRASTYAELASEVATNKNVSSPIVKCVVRDLHNDDDNILKPVLEILTFCLQNEAALSLLKTDELSILNGLFKCMKVSKSSHVMKSALQCLAVQKLSKDVLSSNFSSLVEHVEEVNSKLKAMSVPPLEDVIHVFTRLDEQCPSGMVTSAFKWGRLIFPGLGKESASVREKSLVLLQKYTPALHSSDDMRKLVIKAIGAGLSKSLKILVSKLDDNTDVLKTWALIVSVAGKDLHKGPSINLLLEVIELGFKGSPQSRIQSFIAWRSLIDNFSIDQGIISDHKRIKLIMMVLKVDNAKTEAVALEKLRTWWYFIVSIGPKLTANFDQIVVPLLQLCVGSSKLTQSLSSITQTPHLALGKSPIHKLPLSHVSSPKSSSSQQLPEFPQVQKLGIEVIGRILARSGKQDAETKVDWSLEMIPQEVLAGSASFLKHAPVLLLSFQELIRRVGRDVDEALLVNVWTNFVQHLRSSLEGSAKTETKDVFSHLLSLLRTLVQEDLCTGETLMKLIEICSSFPHKILASTAYNITGGHNVRACPALLLAELLLTPQVITNAVSNESFFKLFTSVIGAGTSNVQGTLPFLQSVTELLDSQSGPAASADMSWRLWSVIAHSLLDNINSTNEVNQGDSLEYNFSCLTAVLLLPIKNQLPSKLSQAVFKSMIKLWKDIYHSFARLSALVSTAEANACLEETSSKILNSWLPEFKDPVFLEFLSSICQKALESADFSGMSGNNQQSMLTLSPNKWARRRQKPLGNLHSLVHLLATVQREVNQHISAAENEGLQKKSSLSASLMIAGHSLVDSYSTLFSHITSNGVITQTLAVLAEPMSCLYNTTRSAGQKLFITQTSFINKLERLWQEVTQCITGRYSGQYDSEFLEYISPLLETTFLHSKRAIKNHTQILWNTTFSRTSSLAYPEKLRPVLTKVKEKMSLSLPGWVTQEQVVAETPFSQMSMGESQAAAPPPPPVSGMLSPKRNRGSMLHRDLSPSPSKKASPGAGSPGKIVSPRDAKKVFSSLWSKMAVDAMKDEEFVVISSPRRKKMVLTEHQKEVMKEKSAMPAMYNSLEVSQDVSLMAQFAGDNTQQSQSSASMEKPVEAKNTVLEPKDVDSTKTASQVDSKESEVQAEVFKNPSTPRRRKSTRILELKDLPEPLEISPRKTEDILTKVEKESRKKAKASNKSVDVSDESSENQSEIDIVESSMEVVESPRKSPRKTKKSEADIVESSMDVAESPHKSKSPKKMKKMNQEIKDADQLKSSEVSDSPFGMFRNKEEDSSEAISLSQDSATKRLPRRVSLRKVHSQNDMEGKESPDVKKMPRRVPLKKLSEASNELSEDEIVKSPSKQQKLASPLPSLDEWLSRNDIGKTKDDDGDDSQKAMTEDISEKTDENPLKISKSSSVEYDSNSILRKLSVESDTPPDVFEEPAHTLVEDTQSPFKMSANSMSARRHAEREHDKSVAETPTKSDCGPSPIIRSVRKLFMDQETDDAKATKSLFSDPPVTDVTCSQGFDPSKQQATSQYDADNAFGFSEIEDEQNAYSKEKEEVGSILTGEQSDHSVPNSDEPGDKFSLDLMSTLASQPIDQGSESKSSSEENQTVASSSESDFNPLASTLDDTDEKLTPNKRKRGTPKKNFDPVKPAKQRTPFVKKESDKKLTFVKDKPAIEKVEEKKTESNESDILAKLQLTELSPAGEITPETKSPSTLTPRRHSTAKRRGISKLSKCYSEPKKILQMKNSSKKTSLNFDEGDGHSSLIVNAISVDEFAPLEKSLDKISPQGKKRKLCTPKSEPRHSLRTRKVKRKLSPKISPPHKLRKLAQSKSNGEMIDEKRKSEKTSSSSEDDVPLSQLAAVKRKDDIGEGCNIKGLGSEINSDHLPKHSEKGVENELMKPTSDGMSQKNLDLAEKVEENTCDSLGFEDITETTDGQPYSQSQDVLQPGQQMMSDETDDILEVQEKSDSHGDMILDAESELMEVSSACELPQSDISTKSSDVDSVIPVIVIEEKDSDLTVTEKAISECVKESSVDLTELPGENDVFEAATTSTTSDDSTASGPAAAVMAALPPDTERALHDWSPTKSPSSSILKKSATETPPSVKSRRVSFADPVVSGESPLREKYHSEVTHMSSPAPHGSPGRKMRQSFGRRRRLEPSLRKDPLLRGVSRGLSGSPLPSPTPSPQPQSSYRATQESQLDPINPIFPDLIGCQRPLDNILPQLTSSLWYRGLCQMMKGRNLNTIGDLSSLTEVQVNQLPVRAPKVHTVRNVLSVYMTQQGLQKPLERNGNGEAERNSSQLSPIKEMIQPVIASPANIADEGLQVRASDDAMLQSLSPIKETDSNPSSPRKMLAFDTQEVSAAQRSKDLANLAAHPERLRLGELSTKELFEMHQTLNSLFGHVVEEMKSRQPSSPKS